MASEIFVITTRKLPRERRLSFTRPAVHEVHRGGGDGNVVLTCGRISPSARTGQLAVGGELGGGLTLHRRRVTRFELTDAGGAVLAVYRQRAPRPGRSWRPSWEVTVAGSGRPVVITEDATFSTRKAMLAEARGEALVHHHADGLTSDGYSGHAEVTYEAGTCPLDLRTALIASLIAWRTFRPADPS